MYVATLVVQDWIDAGYSDATIFRKWNGGDGRVKAGYNAHGVYYDTGAYALKALAFLQ